ncbi:uncharacterized protein LOC119022603 isoform X3 [Acanthopagrus latus]|uniref:uncharacterized protein LOC119022603 isoform X3 n=1 Tax=Acanthopagrus latus TaxID=8177 RepID=UPI00187C37B0|nr:uncharacterized protein LOC119022603 isoform X3 [Acanthopagrus latus]
MGQGSSSPDTSVDKHSYWSHLPKKYKFVDILGEGSYGKVLRCQLKESKCLVAVKIPKQFQNDQEASMLKKLMKHKFDQHNIVKFHDSFNTVFGKAMVFETLDMNLLQYISSFRRLPMKLSEVRTIVRQVATALNALKSIGIIHGDLKLNNIMLVDHVRKPLELKVIDFGLAMKTSKVKQGKQVQILSYRAPEVILGLPLSEAIDMWALGNMMFSLVTGGMFHAPNCEYDAINVIVKSIGQPADHLLENGIYTAQYFTKTVSNTWRIKTQEEYFGPKQKYHHVNIRTLDDWKSMGNNTDSVERDQCFELLEAMLKPDPNERITPSEVLKHPFITSSFNSNDASGSAQKKPSICPQREEKEKVVPTDTFHRTCASGYVQKRQSVHLPLPQWSTPSDTDSCMIFNFGTNSPKPLPQPSPSICESLNCEPPDTAVMADAINNIQPDHQSPPPTVHPSDVITVHPAAGLGSQDHHRLLCKIKVGPASPENTTELEDEENSVRRIFYIGNISPRSQPSPSICESFNCEPLDTAVMADANSNIQPDHQSPPPTVHPSDVITVHPAAGLGSQDHHRLLCKIKVGPASPENTTELEDEENSVRRIFYIGNISPRSQPSPSICESFNCEPLDTAVMADANSNIQPDHQSPPPTVHPSDVITVHPAAGLGSQDHHRLLCKIKVGPASPENTTELEDEENSVSLETQKDKMARTQPSTSTKEFFNSELPATALNTANIQPDCQGSLRKIKVLPAAPENTSELEDEEGPVSLQAGLDPISESTVKVKESDEMETKEKKKKRKKNRVQRVFAWMRKTFSCLSCNRNVMG